MHSPRCWSRAWRYAVRVVDEPLVALAGVFCAVVVALIVVVAVFSGRRERRNRESRRQWADRNGWTLVPHPRVDWGERLPGGNKRGVDFAFSAVLGGRPVSVAEYSVTDASDGTSTNTHHHVVTVVRLSRSLPPTEVEPRGRASRMRSRLAGPGETATGNPEFDRDFRIRTSEPAALPQWFSPSLVAAHLTGHVPSSWSVRGVELLRHRPGRLDPPEVPHHAAAVLPLATLLDGPAVP
jgi:hypothetical protein